MAHLIDKAALVAEIERLRERFIAFHHRDGNDLPLDNYGKMRAYNEVLSFIDTLEVKEVDLEKIWKEYFKYRGDVATVNVKHLAKYFFELGMQVSNKAQKGEEV